MKNKIENIRKEQGILQDEMAKALGDRKSVV